MLCETTLSWSPAFRRKRSVLRNALFAPGFAARLKPVLQLNTCAEHRCVGVPPARRDRRPGDKGHMVSVGLVRGAGRSVRPARCRPRRAGRAALPGNWNGLLPVHGVANRGSHKGSVPNPAAGPTARLYFSLGHRPRIWIPRSMRAESPAYPRSCPFHFNTRDAHDRQCPPIHR